MLFSGVLHLTCEEMSKEYGGSAQGWRRQARLGRVPAVNFRYKWYFNPDEAFNASIKQNSYTGDKINNAEQQGAESDFMSDFD